MKDYKTIKAELLRRQYKTTHFTKRFLADFIAAYNKMGENLENGVDDSYKDGYVTLFHCYDPVYESKFYRLNSCAYCGFLEIVNS